MANLNNFNANEVEPASFEPLPAGKYLAVITESEMRATKSGTGQFLYLTFQVLEGQFKGRKVWARLNLKNPNPQAEQIARGQLSAICRAVGVMQPRDSVELHNLPLVITVKVKNREDTGEPQNDVTGYAKKESSPAAPPQAATSTPPWRRQ
jgi:hypothetical protein